MNDSAIESGPRPSALSQDVRGAKNVVLCSDGTGNSGGKGHGTNVWRLYNSVDLHGHVENPRLRRQVVFYDDGVGTEDFKLWKLLGGAFGFGLSRNIRELYAFLIKNYRPGDNLYVFGFSRGAFTARSLAGLVCRCGVGDPARKLEPEQQRVLLSDVARFRLIGWIYHCVLRRAVDPKLSLTERTDLLVRAAFKRYRREHYKDRPIWPEWMRNALRAISDRILPGFNAYADADSAEDFKRAYSYGETTIRCVGVWDTVGALGAPSEEVRWLMDRVLRTSFHRQELHRNVEHGFHALSIDDERQTFHPVMWQEKGRDPNTIEQVWFAGAHSNVGGGYPKQGLAHVSMLWMMRKAEALGLRFQAGAMVDVADQANVTDKLYDPRAGLGAYYRYSPRSIEDLATKFSGGRAKIHASVFHRIASGVQDYAPAILPPIFEVVDERGAQTGDRWRSQVRELVESQTRLAHMQPRIRRLILTRKFLYMGTLITSLLLAVGTLSLWLRPPEQALDASAERIRAVVAAVVPSFLEGLVLPLAHYFGKNPLRLAITVGLLIAMYTLRNVLDHKAQQPFIEFWSQLRTKLLDDPAPAEEQAEPERQRETG